MNASKRELSLCDATTGVPKLYVPGAQVLRSTPKPAEETYLRVAIHSRQSAQHGAGRLPRLEPADERAGVGAAAHHGAGLGWPPRAQL